MCGGTTITAVSISGGYTPNSMAHIFDTATLKTADPNLGSLNQACPGGGPGVSKGWKPGKASENCIPQGKVVILHPEDGLRGVQQQWIRWKQCSAHLHFTL
jgi:hypothetical protein